MPERAPDQPTVERAEAEPSAEQLQQQYDAWMLQVRAGAEQLYEDCQAQGKRPAEVLLERGGIERAAEAFGSERVTTFIEALKRLKYGDKQSFVDQLAALNEPFVHDRFFNPEVRAHLAAMAQPIENEGLPAGKLLTAVHPCEWNFTLSDGTHVSREDRVVEVSWPDDPTTGPQGAQEYRAALRSLAQALAERPEIKAVVAQSWMMSHPLTRRIGFEVVPEAAIRENVVAGVVGWATSARADKPYRHNVSATDVKVGAISREEFLKRYG